MMQPQTLKGFRDFLPADARKRQYVIDTLKKVFESYGFEPLETPVLEYGEILAGKYGDEGDQLMYRFKDRGDRDVAMRYDQTVPLARVVAQYGDASTNSAQSLPTPFKRYQIQNVWRAENTQKGRYREFLQCDIDTVGVDSPLADAELLGLIYDAFKALGLDIIIKYNDRALLQEISDKALTVLDKLNKIGEENVIKELREKGFSEEEATNILTQAKSLQESLRLLEIKKLYQQNGYPEDSLEFDGTLVRGLNYYTGIIVEVTLRANPNALSLGGGGRYDNLIGMFAGKQIPAVGFAFGFDRIIEAMDELNLFPAELALSTTQVLVTIFSEELKEKSLQVANALRNTTSKDAPNGASRSKNIPTEIYLGEIKAKNPLEKQLKYADQKNIPYVIIIGPEEAKKDVVTLKNLKTREQKQLKSEELLEAILSSRTQ